MYWIIDLQQVLSFKIYDSINAEDQIQNIQLDDNEEDRTCIPVILYKIPNGAGETMINEK